MVNNIAKIAIYGDNKTKQTFKLLKTQEPQKIQIKSF